MNRMTVFADQCAFFRDWISDPLRVASIFPSSNSLGRLITHEIAGKHAPVIELGPGTGVFTRHLVERGIPEHSLALIESGEEFATLLTERFPSAHIFCMDASLLDRVKLFDGELAGAVVSGLPLVSMSNQRIMAVLHSSFAHLRPGGAFYQFTYGVCCPISRSILESCGLRAQRLGGTLLNIPPASVYRISRDSQPEYSVEAKILNSRRVYDRGLVPANSSLRSIDLADLSRSGE